MRPLHRLSLGTVLVATAAFGAACSSVFKQPEVRLENVSLSGIGLRGASLVARLHIDNPNRYDLQTRSMTYNLELQDPDSASVWVPLARDTITQQIEVRGHSAEVVEIPIDFSYNELGPAVRALLQRGTFGYRVSGRIEVSKPISRGVPYRKTGRVTLQGAG